MLKALERRLESDLDKILHKVERSNLLFDFLCPDSFIALWDGNAPVDIRNWPKCLCTVKTEN